jgi:hypothetical protein
MGTLNTKKSGGALLFTLASLATKNTRQVEHDLPVEALRDECAEAAEALVAVVTEFRLAELAERRELRE